MKPVIKNHKIAARSFDFPFQNHKPNTNFRFMIFPFIITNTNSQDWEFETNWTQKKKMENEVEWDQRRWGWNGAVPVLDCLWACGRVSERTERWRGRSGRVRQWVRELRQLGTGVRVRTAVRGRAIGPAVRLGVSEIVSWRNERRRCELKRREAGVWAEYWNEMRNRKC